MPSSHADAGFALFNLPFGLFDWIDRLLNAFLPAAAAVVVWAILAAIVSMLLYTLLSRQETIAALADTAKAARRDLARYDGDFDGLPPLVRRTLTLSLRQLGATIWPATLASLPLLSLLLWLSDAYSVTPPPAGSPVEARIEPTGIPVSWDPPTMARKTGPATWSVTWPEPDGHVTLRDGQGRSIAALPGDAEVTILVKRRWWNLLIGNPAGYLPAEGPVESLEMALPARQLIDVGPAWARSWEALFLTVLIICSLGIKLAFRIR